jgi:putative transposase
VGRKPRENVEDGIYHVYARGNNKSRVFRDDGDWQMYLRMLGRTVVRRRWECLAFCLMTNHVHLLLETPDANLSQGMRDLQSTYARVFNARHGRSGHVFQGRYGVVRITSDQQLCAVAGYLARNPVEAGLCSEAPSWPWSSFRATVGASMPAWLNFDRLLSFFGADVDEARRTYVALGAAAF